MPVSDEEMQKLLESLLAEAKINNAYQKALATKEKVDKEKIEKLGTGSKVQRKDMVTQLKTASRGFYFLRMLSGQLNEMTKTGIDLQKRSLAIGLTFGQMMGRTDESVAYLNDGLTGYATALTIGTEAFEVGFRSNNKEVARLALATKLTGGQSKKLLAGLKKNTAGLGFSQEELSKLSDTTLSVSQKYNVSTETLVDAVGKLGDQLQVFGVLGIAEEMEVAGTRLGAALGPALADLGPDLLGHFTKGSTMIQASILGISKEREALLKGEGNMTRNAFAMILKGGEKFDKVAERYKSGSRDSAFALERATDIYSKESMGLWKARKALEERARAAGQGLKEYTEAVIRQEEISENFTKTWDNFKQLVLSPFQDLFLGLMEWVEKLIIAMGPWAVWIGRLVVAVGAFVAAVAALKLMKFGAGMLGLKGMLGGGAGKVGDVVSQGAGKGLEGLGGGLQAIGTSGALKGALTIAILAVALIPFAFALKMIAGLEGGWEALGLLSVGLIALSLAAALIGFGAPLVIAGAIALGILGVALLPLALGLTLAAPAMESFGKSLGELVKVGFWGLLGLATGLSALGVSLVALTAGSVLGGIADFFGVGPVSMLERLAETAQPVAKLAGSLKTLDVSMSNLDTAPLAILGEALETVTGSAEALDNVLARMEGRSAAKPSLSPFEQQELRNETEMINKLDMVYDTLLTTNQLIHKGNVLTGDTKPRPRDK